MQRSFLSNLFFLLFINLLVKPFWVFGIDRTVQNTVGTEAYGTYFALLNLSVVLNILLDLGMTNHNNRQVAQDHGHVGRSLSGLVGIRLILAVAYTLICIAIGWAMQLSSTEMIMLYALCVNQFLISFILFLRSNVSGIQQYRADGLLSVLDRLLLIVLCAFFLWSGLSDRPFTISLFVVLQTITYVITALIVAAVVWYHGRPFTHTLKWAEWPAVVRQSFPYALLILLMSIYGRIDGVMLKVLAPSGDTEAGVYAQAFRLIDAANMMAYLFAAILLPLFAKMLHEHTDVGPTVRVSLKLLFIPAMALVAMGLSASNDLMQLLYHENAHRSGPVLRLLVWSFLPIASGYVVGTLLTASGNLRELNIIAAFSVLTSVLLNWVFIPVMGAVGAAITSVVVQMASLTFQVYVAQLRYKFAALNWRALIPVGYAVAVLVLSIWMSTQVDSPNLRMVLPPILALCLGPILFDEREWKEFLAVIPKFSNRA